MGALVSKIIRCSACGRRNRGLCPECKDRFGRPPSEGQENEFSRFSLIEPPEVPGYRTRWVLGRGGFGTVVAAEPLAGGPLVAIKIARAERDDAVEHLHRELEVLRAVGPPYVPAVYGSGSLADGSPFVALEHIDAPTLGERLCARPLPLLGEACSLVIAALSALEVVHARGYVHRDLKPENIFVDGKGRAILVDFGLAEATSELAESTSEGLAPGTPEYMAPEQCEGRADVDVRADVYAMGVILYELIAGRPPFWGAAATVRQAHQSHRPPRIEVEIPTAIEAVVMRCLQKQPSERFESAAAMRAALLRAQEDPSDTPVPSVRSVRSNAMRREPLERRSVGLLYFEGKADVVAVQRKIASLGATLGHASSSRYIAIFDQQGDELPARAARRAAEELFREGLCRRALIDVAAVSVKIRADGTRRYLSPLFARPDLVPPSAGEPGLFLTTTAVAAFPEATFTAEQEEASTTSMLAPEDETLSDVRAAPFVGRAELVDALLSSAHRAIAEARPTIATVIGVTGLGKSHLGALLGRRLSAQMPDAVVLELKARASSASHVDRMMRELLRQALDLPDAPPADLGRAELVRSIGPSLAADLGPTVALALGWLDAHDETTAHELRAREVAPGALRSGLILAAGEGLRRRASRGGLCLILDDAHFTDDTVLAALEYATLAEASAPIWICALARPAFESAEPTWGERAKVREAYELAPLELPFAHTLCRRLLLPARDMPEAAIARLCERAQGVPLLLVELVRGLRREGIVRRHPSDGSWYLATDELDRLPDIPLIEWLARAEIEALAPTLAAHARLCALLGPEVSLIEIEGVLARLDERGEADELPLDAQIGTQRLCAVGMLIEPREGFVSFRHPLYREAVARDVPPGLRSRVHLAAYEHHRDDTSGDHERRLLKLAYHAAEAGLEKIARGAYMAMAERARMRHSYVEAEVYYSRALSQAEDDRDAWRGAAFRGRGMMRYRLGRHHDALEDFQHAFDLAGGESNVFEQIAILLDEAMALDWMDEYKRSQERVDEAMALVDRDLPPALAARLVLGLGRSLHRSSNEEEAAIMLEMATARAEMLGDEGYETLVVSLLMLGFIYQGLGRPHEAGAALDRAIALCESHGDALHLVSAINNRGLLKACLGDKEGMVADLSRVLTSARELGLGMLELMGEFNLGEYLYLMDDIEAAEPHIGRALSIERRRRGNDVRPVISLLEARLSLYRGDVARAREIVLEICAQVAQQGIEGASMAPSEEVLCQMVDLATRDAKDEEWNELEARSARFSVGQEQLEVIEARARAALQRGRVAEGCAILERALAAATQIPNVMQTRLLRQLESARRMAA